MPSKRPSLCFPPPPDYPPPMSRDEPAHRHHHSYHAGWGMTTSAAATTPPPPTTAAYGSDYSYAYYEPGPATKHVNVPSGGCGGVGGSGSAYKEGTYRTRHTYTTRYGTEENIYEEISELTRVRMRPNYAQRSALSLNQVLVEEEVRRVQSGHRRVLDQLNLSVEAMLMPSSEVPLVNDADGSELADQLSDLMTIGPTDELLSPVVVGDLDSGFSGSSSGASYRSTTGSLRSSHGGRHAGDGVDVETPSRKFWGKRGWKRLAALASPVKGKDQTRARGRNWGEESELRERRTTAPPALQHQHSRSLQHTNSQRSSEGEGEGSWCSGSDRECSSDDESDRSTPSSIRSSGQLRNTLSKARTLWKGPRHSLDSSLPADASSSSQNGANQGRLSRWFSIRRGSSNQYNIEGSDSTIPGTNKMPLLPEMEEETFPSCTLQQRRQLPPSLPPPPPDLNPQQLKRRMIVAAIVHSENSYVATLQRLVNDYKKPLEESNPPILSSSKISTLFYRLPEILQCHTLFRIALAECVRNWDRDEKIGDVFVASFSKAIVLDIYSGFINNFSVAMDLAKMEAKRKSALADFLKVKQISSHDRLSFFGLMVKPVQRFPQFILLLQDLLKHTPQGHHDRMSLQLALTQLESLAEMLNERKREAEQFQAFREMLRNISGKFAARPLSDGNRYLLREDNVTQLEFNQNGMITKTKNRRLLLLNDLVVCVAVTPKTTDDFCGTERLSLKWTFPVSDVEIQDTSTSPTLSRLLSANTNKSGSLKSNTSYDGTPSQCADNLCTEMSILMHDYEVISRIADLIRSLKGTYEDLCVEQPRSALLKIQSSIQQKDEEMAWVDSCCLQLVVKAKGRDDVFTFQTNHPSVKKEWVTELRLAQLALDPNNSPAWEVPEQEQRPSTKMPLFVRAQCVRRSQHQTEVRCGCFYTLTNPKTSRRRNRTQNYLWMCATDGASSHITILLQHQQQSSSLKEISTFSMVETQVTSMEYVKGIPPPCHSLASDTVWMGTDSGKLILYAADEPEKPEEIASTVVPDVITQIKCHCDTVFVALACGKLLVYRRNAVDGVWLLREPQVLGLGDEPVSCLLPINLCLYAACGRKVWVLSGITGEVQKSFGVQHEHGGRVNLMAHSGIGLWISLKHSSTICLYHTETFKHLQDINIASNVMRVTNIGASRDSLNNNNSRSQVNVTALMACKGLLWVGTNVGICLTIPLPRLEGVPIISGRVNISYHAHFGPISFLFALQPRNHFSAPKNPEPENMSLASRDSFGKSDTDAKPDKPEISKLRHHLTSSPVSIRRRRSRDNDVSRLSKTLPRLGAAMGSLFSTGSTSSQSSADICDVYGLYGQLMYPKDYVGDEKFLSDPVYESLRRSDPELAAVAGKVNTLDRRLKMKVSRPRSLDLSNWSVDSHSSSVFTSSGSEESMSRTQNSGANPTGLNASGANKQVKAVYEAPPRQTNEEATIRRHGGKNNWTDNGRRTVITLMGGRGYVNWRQPCCWADKNKNGVSLREPNCNDAHIVIWELKL